MEAANKITSTEYINRVKDSNNTFESLSRFLREPMTFNPRVVKSIIYDVYDGLDAGDCPVNIRAQSVDEINTIISLFYKSLIDSMYMYVFKTTDINKSTINTFIEDNYVATCGMKSEVLELLRNLFEEIDLLESLGNHILEKDHLIATVKAFIKLVDYTECYKVKNAIDYIELLIEESKKEEK